MRGISRRVAMIGAGVAAALAIGTGSAVAATSVGAPQPSNATLYGCVSSGTRTLEHFFTTKSSWQKCPNGFGIAFNSTGPKGATGAAGAKGATGAAGPPGAQGPSGIVSSAQTSLVSSPKSIATGGSFVTNSTDIGTVSLKAGTYLLTFNAKATPNATSGTAEVNPQFFVYDQVANPSFTGDLFNIGSGGLEPTATNHDSYFSGTEQVTLTQATTLQVYAFGYDSDSGASTYALDNADLTATLINAGS